MREIGYRYGAVKTLAELIREGSGLRVHGDPGVPLAGLACDSRLVQPGFLFAALPGTAADGAQYIPDALGRGAVALLVPAGRTYNGYPVPVVESADPRRELARMLAAFYDHPSGHLDLVGVTGTKGKTTTTYLTEAVLRAAGCRTGVVGTIAYRIGDEVLPATHTTPDACALQALLARMVAAGVTHAAMEVSSHALHQHRADYLQFRVAVFTNLSRDHLDYHRDFTEYLEAKARLFVAPELQPGGRPRLNVINSDDPAGRSLLPRCVGEVVTFGVAEPADYRAANIRLDAAGTTFDLQVPGGERREVRLPLVGSFNVHNALAALAAGVGLGVPLDTALAALAAAPAVRGRFERVPWSAGPTVVVDYAHTPDSLEQALTNARALARGRLLVVFGCGGNRDTGKRPMMGEIAARLADLAWVTSDNPRKEDPLTIIEHILAGIPDQARQHCRVEPDRAQAITEAIAEGREGDLVLVAGKGHEDYQIFADRTIHFDDAEVARAALARLHPIPEAG